MLIAAVTAGCAGVVRHNTVALPPRSTAVPPATHGATSGNAASEDAGDENTPKPLDGSRRAQLGLPAQASTPSALAALNARQWADPQAVAVRYVLVDTNYSASDDPAAVAARRAIYATARLGADLTASSSGRARLDDLRRQRAVLTGEVLEVSDRERQPTLAVVEVAARLTVSTAEQPAQEQLRFYQLTLGLNTASGQWLVARVEQS